MVLLQGLPIICSGKWHSLWYFYSSMFPHHDPLVVVGLLLKNTIIKCYFNSQFETLSYNLHVFVFLNKK